MVVAFKPLATGVGKGEFEEGFILKVVLSGRFVGHINEKVELIWFTACPKVEDRIMTCISLF